MKNKSHRDDNQYQDGSFFQLYNKYLPYSPLPSKDFSNSWKSVSSPGLTHFKSNEHTGKWCIVLTSGEVDKAWEVISDLVKSGQLLFAKVSTALGAKRTRTYVICIYTLDWSNHEDLERTRKVLFDAGFTQPLNYKRDIETINKVYDDPNEFYLTM